MIKSSGTFYIKKGKSNSSWMLYYQYWENGKRFQKKVQELAYKELGFLKDYSIDAAKKRCKQLNAERSIEKDKIRKAADNVVKLESLNETLFPIEDVENFKDVLDSENFGSEYNLEKTIIYFNFVQKMVIKLKLTNPSDYKSNSKIIYKYFINQKISYSYSQKILTILNKWGKYLCKKRGQFFEPLSAPKGRERSTLEEAHSKKEGVKTASDPLTIEILDSLKSKLSNEHYNWLYLSLWLGLRPEEIDSLHDPKSFKTFKDSNGITIIGIYQSKLMSISEDKRWKYIPLIFEEQIPLIDIIKSKKFKRPLNKIIKKYSDNYKLTGYAGRKGFVDLCLDRGQNFLDISSWMGHQSPEITYKRYKNKNIVRYTPTKKVAS